MTADQQTDRQATPTPELKPCPFCASRAVIAEDAYDSKWVICDDCGACTSEVGVETIEQAIERWNRRPIESLERENTALREALALLVSLRDEAERAAAIVEDSPHSVAAIARWRDRWVDAFKKARAALQPETPK